MPNSTPTAAYARALSERKPPRVPVWRERVRRAYARVEGAYIALWERWQDWRTPWYSIDTKAVPTRRVARNGKEIGILIQMSDGDWMASDDLCRACGWEKHAIFTPEDPKHMTDAVLDALLGRS